MASETWDLDERYRVGLSEIVALLKTYAAKDPDGVTISGGEPFAQPDVLHGILEACRNLAYREVLVYTGFSVEECRQQYSAILGLIDILITDPFVEGLPTDKIWRGSDNQRLSLLSERARAMYHGRDLDTELRPVDDIPLQIEIFEDFVEVIGIPRRGDVRRIQAAIRKGGSS
jgi:anaerobic ribonucleoside-triphosphate reductase activating protein